MSVQAALAKAPFPIWYLDTTLGVGATVSQQLNLFGVINGRIRGSIESDVAAAVNGFQIQQALTRANLPGLTFGVPRDLTILGANFHYPFDVIVMQPFVRLQFTNGGAPATLLRINVEALPI